jgi:hypothetical protein
MALQLPQKCNDPLNREFVVYRDCFDAPQNRSYSGILKPLKVTFTRGLFFTGLEGKNKIVSMVLAYVCKTAPKRLESNSVILAVLAFHFFRHGNFSVLLLLDTYCDVTVQLHNR